MSKIEIIDELFHNLHNKLFIAINCLEMTFNSPLAFLKENI